MEGRRMEEEGSDVDNFEEKPPKSGIFQRFGYFLKAIKPMALSHHPVCGHFDDHVFILGNKKLCLGCFIGYPIALITLILIFILRSVFIITPEFLYTVGFYLCCSYLLSIIKLTKFKPIKIFSKALIGVGTGFIITSFLISTGPLWLRILFIVIFFQITTTIVNIKRSYDIHKTCQQCEFKEDWDECPGMKDTIDFFRKSGFLSKKTPRKAD
jgi:hypothetical protein